MYARVCAGFGSVYMLSVYVIIRFAFTFADLRNLDRLIQDRVLAHGHAALRALDIRAIYPYLRDQGLLTDEQGDYLLNEHHSPQARIDRLVQWIPQKGGDALFRFIECLKASSDDALGHGELATLLEKLARVEINRQPQRPREPGPIYIDDHRSSELCL